jgi:hypothetical protein
MPYKFQLNPRRALRGGGEKRSTEREDIKYWILITIAEPRGRRRGEYGRTKGIKPSVKGIRDG